MAEVNTEQLAEILVGIARAQYAIVEAMESARPGFKMTHFAPILQTAARTREFNRPPALVDFPARVLNDCQRRGGPDLGQVLRDLEALLGGDDPASLDMTAPSSP
ncbi:MAG TPA: hypothetical protein VMK05_01955 [Burkholderiales bacterium]|nr:hypothetical protein [Burkholderiales bacterium]